MACTAQRLRPDLWSENQDPTSIRAWKRNKIIIKEKEKGKESQQTSPSRQVVKVKAKKQKPKNSLGLVFVLTGHL